LLSRRIGAGENDRAVAVIRSGSACAAGENKDQAAEDRQHANRQEGRTAGQTMHGAIINAARENAPGLGHGCWPGA
jgi:hypothetical protein